MTAYQIAQECRARCEERMRYALDIGGVRTIDERAIVGRVISEAARRNKPRLKLVYNRSKR